MAPPTQLSEVSLLEALRLDKGLTVPDVERQTGVNHKTISRYERGEQLNPNAAKLDALARLYGVRPSVLLDDIRRTARRRAREELADAA
jgi:transcriptional regulator with XRE-family HTH domain